MMQHTKESTGMYSLKKKKKKKKTHRPCLVGGFFKDSKVRKPHNVPLGMKVYGDCIAES